MKHIRGRWWELLVILAAVFAACVLATWLLGPALSQLDPQWRFLVGMVIGGVIAIPFLIPIGAWFEARVWGHR